MVAVITRTLEAPPAEITPWSTRTLGAAVGLSKATIARIWQTFGLQAHRVETFKLSADPQFVEKVRDIVGLYLHPPDRALVLSVDEKTQVQALEPDECELAESNRAVFSTLTTQRIGAGLLAHYNEHCKPFVWTATADAILEKVTRFCERTSETGH